MLARASARAISSRAVIACPDLRLGRHCFIDDGVVIYNRGDGGSVTLGDGVHLYRGTIIEIGQGGCVEIGAGSHISPTASSRPTSAVRLGRRCRWRLRAPSIRMSTRLSPGQPIRKQPLRTQGDIVVGDGAWLGYGVIVLDGVTIGAGAVVGRRGRDARRAGERDCRRRARPRAQGPAGSGIPRLAGGEASAGLAVYVYSRPDRLGLASRTSPGAVPGIPEAGRPALPDQKPATCKRT